MSRLEEYKLCLNIIKDQKEVFNVFDVIKLLNIYFDKISFYSLVGKDLDKYCSDLGIINITKNYMFVLEKCDECFLLWKFDN